MGRVTVFKWRNSRWEMDSVSSGERSNSNDSSFGNDKYSHGYSLSLNNNGNVLIIGAPGEHGSNTSKRGRARVYLYNENRNVWDETFNSNTVSPVDPTISRTITPYQAFDDYYTFGVGQYSDGGSVAVSADGKTIVAGGRTFQSTAIGSIRAKVIFKWLDGATNIKGIKIK